MASDVVLQLVSLSTNGLTYGRLSDLFRASVAAKHLYHRTSNSEREGSTPFG
jgi:hypothetical protein